MQELLSGVTAIAAGGTFACAVMAGQHVWVDTFGRGPYPSGWPIDMHDSRVAASE
jgi:hypothetical protein